MEGPCEVPASAMTTFLTTITSPTGSGPRVAVKDLIDVEGTPTTAGSHLVADTAGAATRDAEVVRRVRLNGGRIVGKTNLHELAYGGTGVNEWFGTPVNPLGEALIPGGSSSGSAVAVATDAADVALGTDSAGSIRTPSACCGTVGLKTTRGRIPLDGIRALAPTLDTVGPMASTVDGVVTGMRLLEPDFTFDPDPPDTVARLRLPGVDPRIDDAVDAALASAEVATTPIVVEGWDAATDAGIIVLLAEAWAQNRGLFQTDAGRLGADIVERLVAGRQIPAARYRAAGRHAQVWRRELDAIFERWPVVAMPTLPVLAPPLSEPNPANRAHSVAVNLAGSPALALPVPCRGRIPASVQLIAGHDREPTLVSVGRRIEAAVR